MVWLTKSKFLSLSLVIRCLFIVATIFLFSPSGAAIECTQGLSKEATIDCLLSALQSDDVSKRREAAKTFHTRKQSQVDRALPILIRAVDDPDVQVRRSVLRALRRYAKKASAAEPTIRKALHDPDRLAQIYAEEALEAVTAEYGDEHRIRRVQRSLERRNLEQEIWDYKIAINYIASGCPTRYTSTYLKTLAKHGDKAMEALPSVIRLFNECTDDMNTRAQAIRTIAAVAPLDTAAPYLFQGLEDPKGVVREAAVQTLATEGQALPETVPALLTALEDEDPDVVLVAVEALCQMHVGKAKEPIQNIMNHYENKIRFKQKKVRKAAKKCLETTFTR